MNLKNISCLAAALLCAALFTACPNADGLHNQKELLVTFEFSGFGDISGDYSIPGNFDGNDKKWTKGVDVTDVVMSNGKGTSSTISVTTSNIQFSLCPKEDWNRGWYKLNELMGNGSDSGTMQNFYINGLNLDRGTATISVEPAASSDVKTMVTVTYTDGTTFDCVGNPVT